MAVRPSLDAPFGRRQHAMTLKRILIVAPLVLIVVLLQSQAWVPTYDAQTTGNPSRVWKFIEASIGDAKLLNPIVNADSASSQIVGLVFDGLLDFDENLELRGRLAKSWEIGEEAYLVVNEKARFPDGAPVDAEALLARLQAALGDGALRALGRSVRAVERLPATTRREAVVVKADDGSTRSLTVTVRVPPRIKFTLDKVDQDFFARLVPVIGDDYGAGADLAERVSVTPSTGAGDVNPEDFITVFEHNPVIVFHLRHGVLFHDGHPFDARDVKFTYEAVMDPRNLSPRTSRFEPIKRLEIIDPFTVRVIYKRLFSPAINVWTIGILPEHLLNAAALEREMDERDLSDAARASFGMRDSRFNRAPIGTGPFRFEQWQSDEMIHLSRNAEYWDTPAQYRDYFYRIIPDPLTQEVEFLTGAIDRYAPQPHQIARYRNAPRFQSFSSPSLGYTYIGYNNRHPLLSDPRVRRALGMAINMDEIIRYILYGEATRITGPYPTVTEWYDPSVAPLPYDPEGALHILRELGWRKNADGWLEKDGRIFEFNLITNNGNLVRKAVMTTAQNAWRKLGIKCNTQLFEWAVFLEDFINPAKFDAVILGWSMDLDPDLYEIWHSSQAGWGQLNFVGYDNAQADELIVRLRREYNRDAQRELAHRLHRLIARDQPYTFLFTRLATQVLDRKIVMVRDDGSFGPLEPTRSGNLFYYFNRWRKLEHAMAF